MARTPRLQLPRATYHVTSRGAVRQAIFRDDNDRRGFLLLLAEVVRRHEWSCLSYCLLTTHYHLLLRTPEPNLAHGMQRLNGLHAQAFNRRHGTQGHVFHRRYFSLRVERQEHLVELSRYIAMNPVRAGLCSDPAAWPWSSYAALVGKSTAPTGLLDSWLLGLFGTEEDVARERLSRFVLEH